MQKTPLMLYCPTEQLHSHGWEDHQPNCDGMKDPQYATDVQRETDILMALSERLPSGQSKFQEDTESPVS